MKIELITKILVNFAGYFDGEIRRFILDENQNLIISKSLANKQDEIFKPSIIIVARKYYQEKLLTYPIDNKSELKKLLKLELHENAYYQVVKSGEGSSLVNCWEMSENVPSAFITLPDSLLLALSTKNNEIICQQLPFFEDNNSNKYQSNDDNQLYVTRSQDVIYSQLKSTTINSELRFSLSIGISPQEKSNFNGREVFVQQLILGLSALPIMSMVNYFRKPKFIEQKRIAMQFTIPLLIVMTGYLAISSSYLAYKKNNLENKLSAQRQEVNDAFEQQNTYDKNKEKYQSLKVFLADKQPHSAIWLVLAQVIEQAKFSYVKLANNRYNIRGVSPKATQLLEELTKNVYVKEALFENPTRTTRKGELFSISLLLHDIEATNEADVEREVEK